MLAGDVFDNAEVLQKLIVFKAIYAVRSLAHLPRSIVDFFNRRKQARYAFSGGNTPVDPS
jgi:hypothetical protein